MSHLASPLEGLTVVDASWGMPGAIATMLFSDYGARVIKVERASDTAAALSITRAVLDRGKQSVRADLDDSAGRSPLNRLLESADIFVESFGPQRSAALGLRHEDLKHSFPWLIQCSLSGYGQQGPWCGRPGYEALVAARMGLMAEQVGHRDGPTFLGHPSVSYGAAFLAVIGTLAAVHARAASGGGQQVDVSLLDSVLAQSPMNWWWNEKDISYLARTGSEQGFGDTRLVTDLFLCADDEYLMLHTGGDGDFKKTADLLGVGGDVREIKGTPEITVPLDEKERNVARRLIPEKLRSMPRAHWLELFESHDIAIQPVLRPGEILDDPQIHHAGVAVELPHPEHGSLTMPGRTISFAGCSFPPLRRAPLVGEHDAVVEQQPRHPSVPENAPARRERDPLQRIRVLDFSAFFATSYGAKILSDLGADVIKVEPPQGDPQRGLVDPFEAANRGKRGIVLDLKSAEGREAATRLIATADVVMHNMRPGKAEKVGIGYGQICEANPKLIYCYLPGFGSSGPRSHQKSFAPLISGLTGLLYEAAGEGNPPVRRAMGNEDYNNGFVAAMSVLMALRHRDETGLGQYVESPQLHSNLLVVSEQCLTRDKARITDFWLDSEQTGFSPLYRLYPTSDGWICIAVVGDRGFQRLVGALPSIGLEDSTLYGTVQLRKKNADKLAQVLTKHFETLTVRQAFDTLDAAGIHCEIAVPDPKMPEFLWNEWAFDTGRVFEQHHPEYGWIREIGHCIHLSGSHPTPKTRAPLLGEHTESVLTELREC